MKKLLSLLLVAGIITLVSCGPSAKEKAKEKAKQDSLANIKFLFSIDSIKKAKIADSISFVIAKENRIKDSINKKESENAFKLTPAGQIWTQHPEWSKEDCEHVAKREIWIGMDIYMVIYYRGLPDHKNVSNYGSGNDYQYCWYDYNPSCFYCKSDNIVYSYN